MRATDYFNSMVKNLQVFAKKTGEHIKVRKQVSTRPSVLSS